MASRSIRFLLIGALFGGCVAVGGRAVAADAAPQPGGVHYYSPISFAETVQPSPDAGLDPAAAPLTGYPAEAGLCGPDCDGQACGGACCGCLCGPPGRFWLRADYLLWWTSGMRLPPLVTHGPSHPGDYPNPATDDPVGSLDQPGTIILYGNSIVNAEARSNVRVRMGLWLDACQTWGLEGDYLTLGGMSDHYEERSFGSPVLARPLYDVELNRFGRQLVSYPGVVEGSVSVDAGDYFQSTGIWGRVNLSCNDACGIPCGGEVVLGDAMCQNCSRVDLIAGYRYYHLRDRVTVREDLLYIDPDDPRVGSSFLIEDDFRARNDFHGAELGLVGQLYRGRWSVELLAKVALGNSRQVVDIAGSTEITSPPPDAGTEQYDAGVFAVDSNSGRYVRNDFAMIPQVGVDIGYQINCNWRAYMGYNVLYWACVARAGEQIDLNVDPRNVPPEQEGGLPFPAFPGRQTSFWAQGVNFGLEYRF